MYIPLLDIPPPPPRSIWLQNGSLFVIILVALVLIAVAFVVLVLATRHRQRKLPVRKDEIHAPAAGRRP